MYNILISILIFITFDRWVTYTAFKRVKNISRPQHNAQIMLSFYYYLQ